MLLYESLFPFGETKSVSRINMIAYPYFHCGKYVLFSHITRGKPSEINIARGKYISLFISIKYTSKRDLAWECRVFLLIS